MPESDNSSMENQSPVRSVQTGSLTKCCVRQSSSPAANRSAPACSSNNVHSSARYPRFLPAYPCGILRRRLLRAENLRTRLCSMNELGLLPHKLVCLCVARFIKNIDIGEFFPAVRFQISVHRLQIMSAETVCLKRIISQVNACKAKSFYPFLQLCVCACRIKAAIGSNPRHPITRNGRT